MIFESVLHQLGQLIEILGIAVLIGGALMATGAFGIGWRSSGLSEAYNDYRANLGRAILLGLEFLVIGDIIGTVAIDFTYDNLGKLAIIVLIRTFLSFAIETEVSGTLPWKRESNEQRGF